MDVELLRPGTVPIAPETVLWFEFLLDQNLLQKHLLKELPDPTPLELISKFLDAALETIKNRVEIENGEVPLNIEVPAEKEKLPTKNIALKLLSLKVAAFIKWDLDEIRLLPFKTQVNLIQDLLFFTNEDNAVEIPNVETEDISNASQQFIFALLLYHRWMLNISMNRITTNWQLRMGNNDITPVEETIFCTPEHVAKTVDFLANALLWGTIPDLLTFACFNLPTENNDNTELDMSHSKPISKEELHAQINFDLGIFYFYKEEYKLATHHFTSCNNSFRSITNKSGFVSFNPNVLESYIRACCGPFDQLNLSIVNHYKGITGILQKDNIKKEISLTNRLNLELDIQGAVSSGTFTVARDLLAQVKALNVVRCVLDRKPVLQLENFLSKHVDTLLWAIQVCWDSFSESDKSIIKSFLTEIVLNEEEPHMLQAVQSNDVLKDLFTSSDLAYFRKYEDSVELPKILEKSDFILFDFSKIRKSKLDLKQLEQKLILTYDHKEIRQLLNSIISTNADFVVSQFNLKWELPIPLQSVLKSMQRGFLQDFAFVLLAKAKEQIVNKNWNSALELLIILDKEIEGSSGKVAKLTQMVKWEILLIQLTQFIDEWPKNTVDKNSLASACEVCLQSNETVLPRTEIAEQCIICLLNLGRWDFLINFDKRWVSYEISSAIALTCQELIKTKASKRFPKNLWDLVLPMFSSSSQSKRNSSGSVYHDTQITNLKISVMSLFTKLRATMPISIVISLLTRIYNILRDEATVELQIEYITLWPTVISNAQSYNTKAVCEVLVQVITQALNYYPNNVNWLRLMGDVNFGNSHYKMALKFYLQSLLILNDYFNLPVRNDDYIFRRMIKCCSSLGCFTQAAVLCQFLEEPDYVLAFRILGEQKSCNDAVDAYYHCFWDINILEYLIHVHNKKGETQRRKCAVQVMGLLELNMSNNEEIQREASNLRKSTFLRALCKQYVL